jgi:protein SMG7
MTERKTEPSLRFCQYSLRFNIRFLHILCAALESALNNSICHNENSPETSAGNKRASDIIDLLLPIFRIYCIWLAAYRGDLFGSNETLRRVVEPTVRCICRVMTLLCTDKYSQNLASCGSCDYLLPEDIEIRGLLSLTDERVPQPCRPYCLDDGQLKPYLEDKSKRLEPAAEFSARILDTLRCAYFLAEDPGVPITHQVLNNSLVFEYQQGTINNANAHYESMGTSSIAATTSLTNGEDAPMQTTNPITGERVQQKVSSAGGIGSENRKNNGEEINGFLDDADNTVVTMLSPFLDCPSPKSEQSGGSLRDSSYGMHTTTANEVAQELLASYRPESETTADQFITPGKFEPLPWNWVYTPTPRRSQEEPAYTGKDNVAYHKHSSHRLSKDSPPSGDFLEDPFVTPGHRPKTNLLRPTSEFGNPSMAATEAAHRNQLLQSFTGGSSSHSSPFANWAQPQQLNQSMPGQTSSPWARGYGDGLVSSSASGFAHSSSMYHGTPGNGILYGAPSNWGYQQNQFHMHNGGPSQEDVSTLAGRMQIGDAALSYDAKIFEGAMRDAE